MIAAVTIRVFLEPRGPERAKRWKNYLKKPEY